VEEEGISREWEAEEDIHREEVGPVALETLIKEEVVAEECTTAVDGSKGEEGEDRFEEAEVVKVDGQEEGVTNDDTVVLDLISLHKWLEVLNCTSSDIIALLLLRFSIVSCVCFR